jgi:hypothetical protein
MWCLNNKKGKNSKLKGRIKLSKIELIPPRDKTVTGYDVIFSANDLGDKQLMVIGL